MNNKEIQSYQSALKQFNPFYGVEFPITSVKLCELINKMRNDYNEKVVELRHKDLVKKIKEFDFSGRNFSLAESTSKGLKGAESNFRLSESEGKNQEVSAENFRVAESKGKGLKGADLNFQVSESTYKDEQNKDRTCYLLDKNSCRVLASSESKTINKLIMVYLDQLEQIFEKAIKAKATEFDRKLSKQGVTWREACRIVGIEHPDLALKYMIKRGHFKRSVNGGLIVRPSLLTNKNFKKADNLGINKEGFRVLTNGFKKLQESAERIKWQCLQFSDRPKLQAMYKVKLEEYEKSQPKVYDEQGFEVE